MVAAPPARPAAGQPGRVGARFHATGGGQCRTPGPKCDERKQAAADEQGRFVTRDRTSAESRRQAALLAGALGLDKAWAKSGLKTGQAMIVCGRYKEVIATVSALEDPATSLAKLHDALAMVSKH